MKLPRWLVMSLLCASALAVLGAGAWWYYWPSSAARQFAELVVGRQIEEADAMLSIKPHPTFTIDWLQWVITDWKGATVDYGQRTPMDLILSRQICQLRGQLIRSRECGLSQGMRHDEWEVGVRFVVEQGEVTKMKRVMFNLTQRKMVFMQDGIVEPMDESQWRSHRIVPNLQL